jgi:hypothetical protein
MADHQAHDKPEQSIRLAQEASVDARVALARTNAAKAQVALRDVNAGTRTLRNETDRAQPDSSMPVPPTSATPQ